ncbi:hypothetical protein JCM6294_746 [Bacteroides pyogenes DSM 20611 = JCM 6294]|uniref:Uncharacterized protein n=1 Tax=Bacteroides pyogenes DSM 20611 = JCM 6294 TaxID=1121100 RepID=W4PDS4_9BACE|nr:hypothetical protein JCM6294_746 [Bacteroides pyogenes DSM 20611 = JCM 6294]
MYKEIWEVPFQPAASRGGQSGTFFSFKANHRKQCVVCGAVKAVFSFHLKPITGSNALFGCSKSSILFPSKANHRKQCAVWLQ